MWVSLEIVYGRNVNNFMGVARVSDIGIVPGNNFQIPKTTDVQVANDYLLASYAGV